MSINQSPARVNVIGRIDTGDGKPEIIRGEYPAHISLTLTGFSMDYTESETDSRVRLNFDGSKAIMERSGIPETRMEFVPGKPQQALYIIPEGSFDLKVECLSLKFERQSTRGTLRISYRLLSAGMLMSENRLLITYTLC